MSELIFKGDETELPAEIAEELEVESQDNMEGVEPRLPKMVMPTGNGRALTLEDTDEQRTEVSGVILHQTAAKAYWAEAYGSGTQSAPDCASHNGVEPAPGYPNKQADLCAQCPNNIFGTGTDTAGNKTRGKACRDVKRVVVLLTDNLDLPYLLTVPPTSLRNFDDYMVALRKRKRPYWSVVTSITCITDKSSGGIEHPRLVFNVENEINHVGTVKEIKKLKGDWQELIAKTQFTEHDTSSSGNAPQGGEDSKPDGEF